MDGVRIVEIKEDITSRNNAQAESIRQELIGKNIFYLNVMSAPGSGKTTLILRLIDRLKKDFRIGVIEADIDSDVDARAIDAAGVKTVQIHTMGACHITCQMSYEALCALGVEGLDIVILENIGNLVCPAEFDTGAARNLVLISVPEGDDKPLKYPLMFEVASAVVVTKTDVMPAFDFSCDRLKSNVALRNAKAPVFCVSAYDDRRSGSGSADSERANNEVCNEGTCNEGTCNEGTCNEGTCNDGLDELEQYIRNEIAAVINRK